MGANAIWGHIAEGTREQWSREDDVNQPVSSLTAGVTGTVPRTLSELLHLTLSPPSDHPCWRKSLLLSELQLLPLYNEALRLEDLYRWLKST